MGKFQEAHDRLFKNVYVDRSTKRKIRAPPLKVLAGKIRGRGKNASKALRPKKTK